MLVTSQDEVVGQVGRCIYCLATVDLGNEHIVPYGLNGPWILRDASCRRCATITSAFELTVQRKTLRLARAALHMRTRRRGVRPTTFSLLIERDGQSETQMVPIEKYLSAMLLPELVHR